MTARACIAASAITSGVRRPRSVSCRSMLTERELARVATACDRLLRAPDCGLGRIAIPHLHMVNADPTWVAPYAAIVDPTIGGRRGAGRLLDQLARDGFRVTRGLTRSMRRGLLGAGDPWLRDTRSVDVLLVSHFGNAALLDLEDDHYFGPLQRLLLDRGRTSLLLLVNHTRWPERALWARSRRPRPRARLLIPRAAPLREETRVWLEGATTRRRLLRAMRAATDPLDRAVAHFAARLAMAAATAANLRLHAAIVECCRTLQPSLVITTSEGDASERVVWHAAHAARPGTVCAGYQHTRLTAHSHAIGRSIGAGADPDVILTVGEVTRAILEASPSLGRVRLIEYGTHRRSGPPEPPAPSQRPPRCVVLPQASESEQAILFEFAIACARLMPTMTFSLRHHPAVSIGRSRALLNPTRLPPNVVTPEQLSSEDDLSRAQFALYRGSSAAIHAVLAGAKPFYLDRPGELNIDPLFPLQEWRETVTTPGDFLARVEAFDAGDERESAQRAWQFCDRYFARLRPEALDELLAMTV